MFAAKKEGPSSLEGVGELHNTTFSLERDGELHFS